MIGYADNNALGLPPEYAEQERFEQAENKIIEKLEKVGLKAFLKSLQYSDQWLDAVEAQMAADKYQEVC